MPDCDRPSDERIGWAIVGPKAGSAPSAESEGGSTQQPVVVGPRRAAPAAGPGHRGPKWI